MAKWVELGGVNFASWVAAKAWLKIECLLPGPMQHFADGQLAPNAKPVSA
jgi:hypothetical protein